MFLSYNASIHSLSLIQDSIPSCLRERESTAWTGLLFVAVLTHLFINYFSYESNLIPQYKNFNTLFCWMNTSIKKIMIYLLVLMAQHKQPVSSRICTEMLSGTLFCSTGNLLYDSAQKLIQNPLIIMLKLHLMMGGGWGCKWIPTQKEGQPFEGRWTPVQKLQPIGRIFRDGEVVMN